MAEAAQATELLPNMKGWLYLGKYNIYDPATVSYVERTEFLKGICGHIDHEETIEDNLAEMKGKNPLRNTDGYYELQDLAMKYVQWRNKGARLPKFSRWVTGMFAGNAEYAKILAAEGQAAAKRKIIMSVDVVDILRCADTPHFRSCFMKDDPSYASTPYGRVPVRIAEECPGIGIVYVDDEDGKMMGRQWMHHAKVKGTGEDIIVLPPSTYGCLQAENVARLMANQGIKVALSSYSGQEVEYVGCFKEALHHDLPTWASHPKVRIIN